MIYVCFNGIQLSRHLQIMLHTCNIPSSGKWKLSTISGCTIISLSFSREGHGITKAAIMDHSNYTLLGIESLWFHQMTDRKGNHLYLKKFHESVHYWHLKDSGYSSYKIKIQMGVLKHSLHLDTKYIPPWQNGQHFVPQSRKCWLMIQLSYYQLCSYITLNFK